MLIPKDKLQLHIWKLIEESLGQFLTYLNLKKSRKVNTNLQIQLILSRIWWQGSQRNTQYSTRPIRRLSRTNSFPVGFNRHDHSNGPNRDGKNSIENFTIMFHSTVPVGPMERSCMRIFTMFFRLLRDKQSQTSVMCVF